MNKLVGWFSCGIVFSTLSFAQIPDKFCNDLLTEARIKEAEITHETYLSLGPLSEQGRWAAYLGAGIESENENPVEMLKLGFRAERDEKQRPVLLPPLDLWAFFGRVNAQIESQIHSGQLKRSEAIFPALIYVREDPDLPGNQVAYRFVRPEKDPYPALSDHWKLSPLQGTVPHSVWAEALANGAMPFDLKYFYHESSHLTEFIRHPRIAAATRRYYQEAIALGRQMYPDSEPRPDLNFSSEERLTGRLLVITELLSVPNITERETIRRLIPQFFGINGPRNLKDNAEFLGALSESGLLNQVSQLILHSEKYLLRHGGALRDVQFFLSVVNVKGVELGNHSRIQAAEQGETALSKYQLDVPFSGANRAAEESLHGIIFDLQGMQVNVNKNPALAQLYRPVMIAKAAKLETALYAALQLGITADVIAEEGLQAVLPAHSVVREYFKSFTEPGELLYEAFVRQAP